MRLLGPMDEPALRPRACSQGANNKPRWMAIWSMIASGQVRSSKNIAFSSTQPQSRGAEKVGITVTDPPKQPQRVLRREDFTVVVMPAYNAEGTIQKTVEAIPAGSFEHILVVDDASADHTVAVAREMGLDVRVHEQNGGYGANQKTCYREALKLGATVVAMVHPDYQYDPTAVPALTAAIKDGTADMTFGSRFANGSDPRKGGMPQYRYWGNRLTTWVENLILGTHFTEMHSGMRAYSSAVLEAVDFESFSDDFVFDTQFMVAAHRLGFRIAEVPIPTRYTEESSSIGIRRSVRYVAESVKACLTVRPKGQG